jgi:preprotein translocase subunit SecF
MAFREVIPPGTNFDFVGFRNQAVLVSLALLAIGVVVLVVRGGFNLGIDFAGGTMVHVRLAEATAVADVRAALGSEEKGATIQDLGGDAREFLIRLPLLSEEVEKSAKSVTDALAATFGAESVDVLRVEAVGPRVGSELRQKAILAVLFATVMMGLYIWARFEWRFGIGAAVALLHDVFLTIAALVVWNYEFDLTIVAALLTVVGFSVNDTVIVSDRIRENLRKDHRSPLATVMNRSINETLSRTVLTTGTALLVVIVLYVLGGSVIHGFAFALTVGFLVGTYSTIYIAAPVVLFFEGGRRSARRR